MTESVVIVKGDAGVHARPAMMLVKEAMKYARCSVALIRGGVEADCKSIMSVLGLAIVSGSKLTVRADGDGEREAVKNIVAMIENNFKDKN
ncbi:MAG: HPr family phosphocarrier protein [Spirochaetes bacterium]|jgi:phosphocarrier protein|nr:HPr family phosphocarrier protein [Spirochaetota bacterium]